ncbi:MAG: hypothetical protein P8P74_00295 [Crocinitomicaceae bacterium]|nr:hypothetical protein [Crocinitomicaceae bacterium]
MALRTSIKNIMLKKFFNGIIAFFATCTVSAQEEPLKVLFIGNSYTHMNNMPKMFDKIAKDAGMNVLVEKCAQSSATFKIHAEERPEVYEAINKRKWDYIILQGFSRELAFEQSQLDSTIVPYADKLTKAIYENNECTNVMFYMTWGYKHGYGHREETDSYDKMTDKIKDGYTYISNYYNLPVVPVGLVWRDVRRSNEDINLYAPDLAHPSKKGSYLVACTFFKAIFGEEVMDHGRIIRKKFAKEISNSADRILSDTREKYKLDRYFIDLNTESIEDERGNISYKLTYRMQQNEAKSIAVWLNGDIKIEGPQGMYEFSKPGIQNLRFDVTNSCGQITSHVRRIELHGVVPKRREEE